MSVGMILAEQLEGTRDWTRKLIKDLKEADWTYQPAPGLAHALWTCGHLAASQDVLVHVRVLGRPSILDPAFAAHFPMGQAVRSAAEHDYPPIESVLRVMEDVHRQTLEVVKGLRDEFLREPAYGKDGAAHPHYRDKLGAISHCDRHEAFHAGQIALIRRLLGKNFLR